MPDRTITGRDRAGHMTLTVVTGGAPGQRAITRQHHPDCHCHTQPARIARRRKPTQRQSAA
jgi:hypothetical protein